MKENMEEFIRQNKMAFDDKEPSASVWKKIDRALFPSHTLWNSVVIWRAAAMVFMVLSIYLLVPKDKLSPVNDVAMQEFTDAESFYVKQISEKVELIDGFERSDGLNSFTRDFQQLEAMYSVLKEEMKARPSKKVKDALVLNLLVQLDLLNQQLHKLEEENKSERETETKTSI